MRELYIQVNRNGIITTAPAEKLHWSSGRGDGSVSVSIQSPRQEGGPGLQNNNNLRKEPISQERFLEGLEANALRLLVPTRGPGRHSLRNGNVHGRLVTFLVPENQKDAVLEYIARGEQASDANSKPKPHDKKARRQHNLSLYLR